MYIIAGIFVAGGIIGIAFLAGSAIFMEKSSTLEACIACHEMEQSVYQEYKESVHYSNRAGVRVICSDCHIPKSWTGQVLGKFKALKQLYHKLAGNVDTVEKFEAKRLEMAETVWAEMEANNSQQCRNCHSYEAMAFHKQSEVAGETMKAARDAGMNCIDCHKGIAHKLPEDY